VAADFFFIFVTMVMNQRVYFYIFLILCFCLGAFFKQFDLFYPKPFVALAFAGATGLLVDYAWRIRHTVYWIIPALLACEVTGDLIYNANFRSIAWWLYIPGALVFVAYGILFFRKGILILKEHPRTSTKFMVLGLLSSSLISWEYATYHYLEINTSALIFKILFLATFAWLLFIDFTTQPAKSGMKVEQQILRVSLLVISAMYFTRFIFK